jgi:ActR/RegA family two-component response regulator
MTHKPPVMIIAHPREAAAWEQALRARGHEVSSARSRKAAGPALRSAAPALVLVSEKLPMAGALRVIRDLRADPATREAPVVLAGMAPLTVSQRLRLGLAAPDATTPRGATSEAVADVVEATLRTGKAPLPELTPAQQAAQRYSRIATMLMMAGVLFALPTGRTAQGFDRSWFMELIPLGGLLSDYTTGRVDGRKRPLSWQGWTAIALMVVMALGIVFWPRVFALR